MSSTASSRPPSRSTAMRSAAIVALTAALAPDRLRRRVARAGAHRRSRQASQREIHDVQPQLGYLQAIRRALPDDGLLRRRDHAGRLRVVVRVPGLRAAPSRQLRLPGHARLRLCDGARRQGRASRTSAVVNIAGDGGFLFTSNEMATAAQYGIALVTVLFNNGKFQNVQRQQKEWFGGRLIGSDLRNPDFVKLRARASASAACGRRAGGARGASSARRSTATHRR